MADHNLPALVIDDDALIRRVLGVALNRAGVDSVLEAADGREAKELIENGGGTFCLVVCDWLMPVMDGMEFLEYFRGVDSDTPFVMLTSVTDISGHNQAKSKGASHFFIKPLTDGDLEARFRSILELADEKSVSA
jgi:DNA-binding NtrC family response regulator